MKSQAGRETKDPSRDVVAFDVYIDESGTFDESRVDADERVTGPRVRSQLAGFFAKRGSVSAESAREAIRIAFQGAGLDVPPRPHAKDLRHDSSYAAVIRGLLGQLKKHDWQPIRIANEENATFGDRIANYTNAVAELILRLLIRNLPEVGTVVLGLHCARVVVSGDDPIIKFLQPHHYRARLEEVIARAAVREGWADHLSRFQIDELTLQSGRERPELWICDILSNASYNAYRNAGGSIEDLRSAFGDYDLSFRSWPWLEEVDKLSAMQYYGYAIRIALDRLVDPSVLRTVQKICKVRITKLVAKVTESAASTRDSHLSTLAIWVEHLIADRNSLEKGIHVCGLLLRYVYTPMASALNEEERQTVHWFGYRLHTMILTRHNHAGDLKNGRNEAAALETLIPKIAGRWEHVPILIDGMVAISVHFADCLEYERCCQQTSLIARYYQGLSGLFADAYPGLFPSQVKSLQCGKALGAWLQAETYLVYDDPNRAESARAISDLAIQEFASESDKARQYQYRAHLETVAGEFESARQFLGRSLQSQFSHDALARAILSQKGFPQGFALLHWLRIGHSSLLKQNLEEWECFAATFISSGIDACDWVTPKIQSYPAHGVLRRISLINAAIGREREAKTSMDRLRQLYPTENPSLNLQLVLAAALIEVALLSREAHDSSKSKALIDAQRAERSATELLAQLTLQSSEFPSIQELIRKWQTGLTSSNLRSGTLPDPLLLLTARFDY